MLPFSVLPYLTYQDTPTPALSKTFESWVEAAVGTHTPTLDKSSVPLFSPCHFSGPRAAATVVKIAPVFVADADDYDEETFLETIDRLSPYTFAVVSTHNHLLPKGKHPPRIRVRWILHLDAPMSLDPHEYKDQWARFNLLLFDRKLDPGSKDLAHVYYQASCPPSKLDEAIHETHLAQPFPLAQLKNVARGDLQLLESRSRATTVVPPPPLELEALFAKWKASRGKPYLKEMGAVGLRLLSGEPFCDSDRHNTLRTLTKLLVENHPDAHTWDGQGLAELFSDSLLVTPGPDGPHDRVTEDELARLFDGALEKFRFERDADLEAQEQALRSAIHRVYPGRSSFATDAELEAFAQARQIPIDDIRHNLLLISGKQIYVSTLDGGALPLPVSRATVAGDGVRQLSVFFPLLDPMAEGLTSENVLKDHAIDIDRLVWDYTCTRPSFNPRFRSLLLPAARDRFNGTPRAHQEVLDWIDIIDEHNGGTLFRDWLSSWNKLDQATAAIVATGPRNTGKTLGAMAMAAMYNTTPVSIDQATGDFPWRLIQCPVVLGDETLGKAYKQFGSEFIRREVTLPTREINRKQHDQAELRGFFRFYFALNDLNLLTTAEDLNNASIDAFAERLAHLEFPEASRDYLSRLGGREYIEANWKGKGAKLLETIAWLGENHVSASRTDRLYVTGPQDSPIVPQLRTSQGPRNDVLIWLHAYLEWILTPKKGQVEREKWGHSQGLVRIEDGDILIAAEAVYRYWDHAFKGNPPPHRTLQRAVAGLSEGQTRREDATGATRRYHVIKGTTLISRADLSSLGREGVEAALKRGSIKEVDSRMTA